MKNPSVRTASPEASDLAENPESFRLRRQWFAEDRPGFETPKRATEIGAMVAALRQPRHALSGSLPSGGARVLRKWLSSGPDNFSGRIRSIALHAKRPQRLVAGTANGGVWVSSDSGRTWRPTMLNEMSLAIGSCAMAPTDFRILFAGTGEGGHGPVTSYAGVGIYKSTDFGATWSLCPGSPAGRCQRMLIDPSDAAIAYAAMDSGLYKTTDGGATWANVYPGVRVTDAVIHPAQGRVLLIGVEDDGVFRTGDGGATWAREQNTHPDGDKMPTGSKAGWISLGIVRYAVSGRDRFAVKLGLRGEQVFVSSRNGRLDKWSEVDDTDDSSWRNLIALDPHREDTLFAGSVNLYRVVDDDWEKLDGTHDDHHDMAFHPTNKNRVWVATDGGLYASIDGGSNWRKASPGLTATQFYSLDVSQTGPFLMVGSTQDEGILRSRGTAVWEDTRAGNEGGFVAIDPSDSHHVFARPWSTGLRRSDDLGESWTTLENGLRVRYRGITSEPAYIRGFAVKPDNGKVLVAAGAVSVTQGEQKTEIYHRGCIFRSTDRGDTWSRRKLAPGDGRSVAFAPSNPKVCYAGMANGRVFRSADAGTTWALRQRGTTLLTSEPVNGIAVDVGDARVVYVCLGGSSSIRVMRSRDSGRTWTDISGTATGRALPTVSCNSLVQDPDHPDVLYVATDIGVFRSSDGGGSWASFNEGSGSGNLPRTVVTRLIIQRRLRLLFASTIGRGVWRIRI